MIDVQKLTAEIAAIVPIHGVSIVDPADKQTWRVDYIDEPSTPDEAAVAAAIAEFGDRPSLNDYRLAVQAHIDATAQQRSYDTGISCASYVGSTNPVWAAEAAAFTAWRDDVWAYAYAELAKVQNGQRPQPTVETILAELPALTWPA
ncbi:hypothetical protein [Bosea thiooxidans]|uniref:hypothetical protein n=1 Tax=Bosea thiooxidans TaxID=53254 RepID=UPI000AC5A2D1|nr:hypothetical protein [Bosea thiooxidans]